MSKQRTILKAASELPPKQARRVAGAIVAGAIAAASKPTEYPLCEAVAAAIAGKADPRAKELLQQPIYDDLLEAAADAMQRAVEAELVPFIEQAAEKLADSTKDK